MLFLGVVSRVCCCVNGMGKLGDLGTLAAYMERGEILGSKRPVETRKEGKKELR